MKSFETTIKPLLKYGDGVAKETGKKFKEFGCTKVLAGYDANLPESVVSTVLDSITAEGIELIPYSCPYADGQDTGVLEVRQLAIDHQVDGFLAMGGGSTMDIVKAATLLVAQPLPIDQYFVGWYNGPDLPRKAHLISIPTTSGTGAEATRSCIIASQTLGVKATLSSQAAKADFVYLDPQITKSLPPYVTATTGMDAIAHACEALCCTKSNLFTEMICGKSLELSWANLLTAYKEPDNLEARAHHRRRHLHRDHPRLLRHGRHDRRRWPRSDRHHLRLPEVRRSDRLAVRGTDHSHRADPAGVRHVHRPPHRPARAQLTGGAAHASALSRAAA